MRARTQQQLRTDSTILFSASGSPRAYPPLIFLPSSFLAARSSTSSSPPPTIAEPISRVGPGADSGRDVVPRDGREGRLQVQSAGAGACCRGGADGRGNALAACTSDATVLAGGLLLIRAAEDKSTPAASAVTGRQQVKHGRRRHPIQVETCIAESLRKRTSDEQNATSTPFGFLSHAPQGLTLKTAAKGGLSLTTEQVTQVVMESQTVSGARPEDPFVTVEVPRLVRTAVVVWAFAA